MPFVYHPLGTDMARSADYNPLYQVDIESLGQLFVKQSVYGELAPEAGDIIIMKPTYDAFFGTNLEIDGDFLIDGKNNRRKNICTSSNRRAG